MIRFIEAGWRNFGSYGNNLTKLSLDFSNPTVIIGRNLDNSVGGLIDSNGSGKTTILNVICYTLYDTTTSDIKKDKLINWVNEKNMETYVIFEKNGTYYKIERYRKFTKKGGNGARIYENKTGIFNDDDTKADKAENSIDLINKQIIDILGMPFEIFIRSVLFSATTESFYALPTAHESKTCQRDILEELFGYKEISVKADLLKKKISEDKKQFEHLFEINEQYVNEKQRLNDQLAFTQNEYKKWDITHVEEIRKLNDKIKLQSEVNFDEERLVLNQLQKNQLKLQEKNISLKEKEMLQRNMEKSKELFTQWEQKKNDEIYSFQTIINRYKAVDFGEEIKLFDKIDTLTKEKDRINKDINKCFEERKKIEDARKKKENELNQLKDHKCPYCLQDFKDSTTKQNEIVSEINNFHNSYNDSKIVQEQLENSLGTLISDLSSLKSQFLSKNDILQKKVEFEMAQVKLEDKQKEENPHKIIETNQDITNEINHLQDEINTIIEKISVLKSMQKFQSERELNELESSISSSRKILENLTNQNNPHGAILEKLQNTVLPDNKNKELEELKDELEHADFLYKLLTKKDSFIRKSLLSKNLPFLNQRLKLHLKKAGLPHKVTFTENMTADISDFGIKIDYQNFSAGQKIRLNLATDFAFRDVLQTRHNKINLCILDEYLDTSLSLVGSMGIAKALKSIAQEENISLFLISHKDEINALFNSKVEVELNNKFSNIVKSDIPFSSS